MSPGTSDCPHDFLFRILSIQNRQMGLKSRFGGVRRVLRLCAPLGLSGGRRGPIRARAGAPQRAGSVTPDHASTSPTAHARQQAGLARACRPHRRRSPTRLCPAVLAGARQCLRVPGAACPCPLSASAGVPTARGRCLRGLLAPCGQDSTASAVTAASRETVESSGATMPSGTWTSPGARGVLPRLRPRCVGVSAPGESLQEHEPGELPEGGLLVKVPTV